MRIFALEEKAGPVTDLHVATPKPTGNEVLLRVTHAGVCHTDTHVQDGGYDLGSRGMLDMTTRGLAYPTVMGHETVGEVVAIGEAVEDVAVGDVRLVFPWIGCRDCRRCELGQENYCASSRAPGIFRWGGFAEYILVPHSRYIIDIAGLDPAWAAVLACSGVTAYSAARKALTHAGPDDLIAVIGTGGVGMMAIAVLHALGHRRIAGVDVDAENLAIASDLGATIIVNSAMAAGGQVLTDKNGGTASAVIDFVNTGDTVALAFDVLGKGGTLVHVGLYGGEFTLPTAMMALNALNLRGNYVGSLEEVQEVVELAKRGILPKLPIVPGVLDADGVNASLEQLRAGGVHGRIVLRANKAADLEGPLRTA